MTMTTLAQPLTMSEACCRYLAPYLLSPFAIDMANRLSRLSTGPLLEIAAGAGTLTRATALAMSAGIAIVATDPISTRFDAAIEGSALARVSWQRADPAELPFRDASFGIIACHFAIATMPDKAPVLREARRVMVLGGRFVFSVPGTLRHNPVAECVQAALAAAFPNDTPSFLTRQMHGYADEDIIDNDLTAAGFTDAMYTTVDLPFQAPASDVALGYCLGTPLRIEIESRAGDALERVMAQTAEALRSQFGSDMIRSAMRATIVSASA
ncbi:MAG TPA: class I SAM-dependent methyltransferase [Rhodopila sp.]|nr:class I SAM-dependent methyltransferase [Rhodopila sp.]